MLYWQSAILGLSFLDPKDFCLPNQFSRGSWQKHSVSTYLTWCQRRNRVASMIKLTLIFNPSYVCHDMNIFWPVSFVKFPRRYWTEFNQSWKTLLSHEIFQSLIDLNGANVGFRSNSRDWVFRIFMMSKINPLMSKNLLFLQLLVNHMIKELYLQNWVPRLEVLHSFLSKGSTWYVHLKFFARCVNSILYLHKNSRNVIP